MKTVYDIMTDSEECIIEFNRACSETASAKFILGEKKISALLQIIAGSSKLYAVMQNATQEFDFIKELKNAVKGKEFILPTGRKKQIALIFGLLYSFDTKKIDLQEFIHNHFQSDNVNEEFTAFGASVIEVFRNAVLADLRGEPDVYADPAPAPEEPKPESASETEIKDTSYLDFNMFSEADSAINGAENALDKIQLGSLLVGIREIIGIVARDPNIESAEREELMLVCEAFEKAVEFNNKRTIKIMYIGLKNTIATSSLARPLSMQADNLDKLVNELDI